MARLPSRLIRQQVYQRANAVCEYCHASEDNTGQPMHIEHIVPNGDNNINNLCLSCASCNMSKATATTALDSGTQKMVRLFNPRIDDWHLHVEWSEDAVFVIGKSPIARATIARLKMNQPRLQRARRNWTRAGNHPPK